MDIWNWVAVVAGLAIAARELNPVWKNRRQKDRAWKVNLFWGVVAIAGALAALILGFNATADADRAERRIGEAGRAADAALQELAESMIGTVTTEQYDVLFAATQEIGKRTGDKLQVVFVSPDIPRLNLQYAMVLSEAFSLGHLGGRPVMEVANAWHNGITVFAKNDSENARAVSAALKSAGINSTVVTGALPDVPLVDSGDFKTVAGLAKETPGNDGEVVIISIGKLK